MAPNVFTSHKTRYDKFGGAEHGLNLRQRFIYLAASANNRVCKVGVSVDPGARVRAIPDGARLFWTRQPFHLKACRSPRLLRQWSLGVVSTPEALAVERGIHLALRGIARRHISEFYLLAPSVAMEYIDGLLGKVA